MGKDARATAVCRPCLVHAAHAAAHAAAVSAAAFGSLFLVLLGDEDFGGQEQAGDAGRVLEGGAGDLGRVDDAGLEEVFVLAGLGVEADAALLGADILHDGGAFFTRVQR